MRWQPVDRCLTSPAWHQRERALESGVEFRDLAREQLPRLLSLVRIETCFANGPHSQSAVAAAERSRFGFSLDGLEGGLDYALPLTSDSITPKSTHRPQVGAQFTLISQSR
jgi:hypothetical protein